MSQSYPHVSASATGPSVGPDVAICIPRFVQHAHGGDFAMQSAGYVLVVPDPVISTPTLEGRWMFETRFWYR